MSLYDNPLNLEEQILFMKKYVIFSKRVKMRRFLTYTGYFRASRYGKFLLSYSHLLGGKPSQDLLFKIYDFDTALRELLLVYSKKAEIQFKSHLSNSISLKLKSATFYLNIANYTPSKGERDSNKRNLNKKHFSKFIKKLKKDEEDLRKNILKYPELKEYRTGGKRTRYKIPSWAAFSYFDLGNIVYIYSYLNGALRKEVLQYGYSRKSYGKNVTKQVDTWLDAIRNLRNVCAHHNKLVGKTSSIVLLDNLDDDDILSNNTDLFSRLYALKKILREKDADNLKIDLKKLINKKNIDIYKFNILPKDWENIKLIYINIFFIY